MIPQTSVDFVGGFSPRIRGGNGWRSEVAIQYMYRKLGVGEILVCELFFSRLRSEGGEEGS